jgi:transposase-like protein/uncharacterized protein YbcV (DUF1398 family)
MNKKQKEALVLAMLEKGESYRSIAKAGGVSPNTIKSIANRAGLDESTSIHSRAFELFSEGKTPLQVAITLNLEAEKAIQYHQQYYMLLGCTEFTKVYPHIKDNPWPYVNLVKLVQNSGIKDAEVIELLKIANGHLSRVKLEYDRIKEELNYWKAETNSWKAEVNNAAMTYQDFCDRNLKLRKREDELQRNIDEMENKKAELQKTITGLKQQLSELKENNAYNNNLNLQIKQEEVIFTDDASVLSSNTITDYHSKEDKVLDYSSQIESSPRKVIFDTKDLY